MTLCHFIGLFEFGFHGRGKGGCCLGQDDPVLRPLGSGNRGNHVTEVKFNGRGEHRVRRGLGAEHALCLGVFFNQVHLSLGPTGAL